MSYTRVDHKAMQSQTIQAYDFLAARYTSEWSPKLDEEIADPFLRLVRTGGLLLDAGCGPAHYARYFVERGFEVVGVDLSMAMLQQAIRFWRPGRLSRMDVRAMGFRSRSFDGIWACASLPHTPESLVHDALKEMRRLLDRDGTLFANVIIGPAPMRIESPEEMGEGYDKPGRFFQWYPDAATFVGYLDAAGFEVIQSITRTVESQVLRRAKHTTNLWESFYCRLT